MRLFKNINKRQARKVAVLFETSKRHSTNLLVCQCISKFINRNDICTGQYISKATYLSQRLRENQLPQYLIISFYATFIPYEVI